MGRWAYSGREEADSLKKVEIYWLKKHNYLDSHRLKYGKIIWTNRFSNKKNSIDICTSTYENPYLQISYTQTDNENGIKKEFDYKISLTMTACHFGSYRYWFKCPMSTTGRYCGRRVGVIYKGADYFACRHCYNLTYASRKLSGIWKRAGVVICESDLENEYLSLKRKYYKGNMTRRYQSYVKKSRKSDYQLALVSNMFGGI